MRAVDGVQAVGRIGQGAYSVTADGTIKAAAIIGYEKRSLGAPESLVAGRYPTADGEGVANETDASEGFDLGDVVRVEPGGYRIRIVGQSRDTNLQATPTDVRPLRHVGGGGAGRQSRRAAAAPERARCGTGAGGYAGRWRLWTRDAGRAALGLHVTQLALNAAWPSTFFTARNRTAALTVIAALDLTIAAELATAARQD